MSDTKDRINLVGDAYRAAAGQIGWNDFLLNLGKFSSVKSGLIVHDNGFDEIGSIHTENYDPDFIRTYIQHFSKLNPWTEAVEDSKNKPKGIWGHDYVSPDQLRNTEFYEDWVIPQGDIWTGFCINLSNDNNRSLSLIGNMSMENAVREGEAYQSLLMDTADQIRHAFELRKHLEFQQLTTRNHEHILNRLANAVFLTNKQKKLIYANDKADKILRDGKWLYQDPSGYLRVGKVDHNEFLQKDLEALFNPGQKEMPHSQVLRDDDGKQQILFIAPMVIEPVDNSQLIYFREPETQFIWFLISPQRTVSCREDILVALFNLTPTEVMLAFALLQDLTLREYAEQRSVSYDTARTQAKSLLSKTGCQRQAELVGKLNRVFAQFNI